MKRVFVIRGFNTKTDSKGNAVDFEKVQRELIALMEGVDAVRQ